MCVCVCVKTRWLLNRLISFQWLKDDWAPRRIVSVLLWSWMGALGLLFYSTDLAFVLQVCSGGTTPDWRRRSSSSRRSSWARKAASTRRSSWIMAQMHRKKVSPNTPNHSNRFHLKSSPRTRLKHRSSNDFFSTYQPAKYQNRRACPRKSFKRSPWFFQRPFESHCCIWMMWLGISIEGKSAMLSTPPFNQSHTSQSPVLTCTE